MKMYFIEKDLLNHIEYIEEEKGWEIANPLIFKKLYLNYSKQKWKIIYIDNKLYKYSYITCSCPVEKGKKGRVYILCPNEKIFEDNSSNIEDWNKWINKHFLITPPIFYDKKSKIYTSYSIYSTRIYHKPLSNGQSNDGNDIERSILEYFINKKCFSIASGFVYYIGLYRSNIITEDTLLPLFKQWVEKDVVHTHWDIDYENIYDSIVLLSGLNSCIGENILLYSLYGNCSENFIKFLFEKNRFMEPICEIITNSNTLTPTFYYLTLYSILIRYNPINYWKILIPYFDRISLKSYINDVGLTRVNVYTPYTNIVDCLLKLQNDEHTFKKLLMQFYNTEVHLSQDAFIKNILTKSFQIYTYKRPKSYPNLAFLSLWNFLHTNYFKSDIEWSLFIHEYLINNYLYPSSILPPWSFLHWAFNSSRKYHIQLFDECSKEVLYINEKIYFTDIYTTLKKFPSFTTPYLFFTHVLKKQIQNTLLSVGFIKKYNKSIGDAIEYFFSKNKNLLHAK